MAKIPTPPEKKCRACSAILPIDEFGIERHARDGRNDECKECRRQAARAWTISNPAAAALRSAREVARREGQTRLTPDEVQAKRAALDAAKATPRPGLADMDAAEDQAGLPPGLLSRQTLAALCGVGLITLHKHRKQNTCGIEDARVQLRRKGNPTRTVFDAEKASAFIGFMKGEGSASG